MIIRKIIILTVLGGLAIFIAGLLLLIFHSCITQLEVRAEREEVENSRGKRGKTERGPLDFVWGGKHTNACVWLSARHRHSECVSV